ncbi:hypothetical protein ABIE18_004262 [Arthrobacter sp. 2762]
MPRHTTDDAVPVPRRSFTKSEHRSSVLILDWGRAYTALRARVMTNC